MKSQESLIMNDLREYFDQCWQETVGDEQMAPRHLIMKIFDMADSTTLDGLLKAGKLPGHNIKNVRGTQIDRNELFNLLENDESVFNALIGHEITI
jgi:hypothetical protein